MLSISTSHNPKGNLLTPGPVNDEPTDPDPERSPDEENKGVHGGAEVAECGQGFHVTRLKWVSGIAWISPLKVVSVAQIWISFSHFPQSKVSPDDKS